MCRGAQFQSWGSCARSVCEFLGRELECREVRFCRRVFCAGFSFGGESLGRGEGFGVSWVSVSGGLALVTQEDYGRRYFSSNGGSASN